MKKPIASPDMDTTFVYEGKIKVYTYYGGEMPNKVNYCDNLIQAYHEQEGAEHYEAEIMNVEIATKMLKGMLEWSDRIGSDEITEIRTIINLLNKVYL